VMAARSGRMASALPRQPIREAGRAVPDPFLPARRRSSGS